MEASFYSPVRGTQLSARKGGFLCYNTLALTRVKLHIMILFYSTCEGKFFIFLVSKISGCA